MLFYKALIKHRIEQPFQCKLGELMELTSFSSVVANNIRKNVHWFGHD